MKISTLVLLAILFAHTGYAQADNVIVSWTYNPGGETSYAGIESNVLGLFYDDIDVYVQCNCIPGYDIGPWAGNPNVPANQDFVFKITKAPIENTGTDTETGLGHIGVWSNGVSIYNAEDGMTWQDEGIWFRDAYYWEGASFDDCLGHPDGNGEYHHHVNPSCLYSLANSTEHSPIIGYAFDGFPIYGAYAYANTDGTGAITRMESGYEVRGITLRSTLPDGTTLAMTEWGPPLSSIPLGAFLEDFEFTGNGDLDVHNGRYCVTPEYPDGTYAYFVTLDASLTPVYPYVLGPTYYGIVQSGNTGVASGHNVVPFGATEYDPFATPACPADINEDGVVDVNDFLELNSAFGTICE